MQNKPFRLSRRRLAAWYTGVMTLILMLCGLVIHRLVVHARWLNLVHEMRLLAGQIETQIRPALKQTGRFEPSVRQLLPELCLATEDCSAPNQLPQSSEAKLLTFSTEKEYCIQFFDFERQILASLQLPADNPNCQNPEFWQTLKDSEGTYYHRQFVPMHTQSGEGWGLMKLARSLNDLDRYLLKVEIALAIMVLLGIAVVGSASWWLAGLAMRPVKQSYDQMQQFTADAAHELRTPLAAMRAIVQAALRSEDLSAEDTKEALGILNRQSYRLSQLVQDLLILCQIDQQGREHELHQCELNTIVKNLVEEFTALALAADIELTAEVCATNVCVVGNPEQIYRAIANLLSNAIQYTPAKGQVKIQLAVEPTSASITVSDTGIGIPPEAQLRIFDRFYRVDQVRKQSGTGLGLAIAQSIVQAHRGKLQVKSKLGKGSQFTIVLPLLPTSDSPMLLANQLVVVPEKS